MRLTSTGRTHVGMKRAHNEDSLRLFREENLFIVADGMGGHASGEVASQMSVESLAEFFRATAEDDEVTWPYKMDKGRKYEENRVITGIKLSNRKIFESASRDSKLKGMGTTIVVVFFVNGGAYVGHVGDSRCYRVRAGAITLLTQDHSLVNEKIRAGLLTPEQARNHKHKNIITRSLGYMEEVEVDVQIKAVRRNDRFLLCSDGLSNLVEAAEMGEAVRSMSPQEAARFLIQRACDSGGDDNVTCVVARIDEI